MKKPFLGNHLRARGFCVDTAGLDLEMIRNHVKRQEKQEKKSEKYKYQSELITGGDSTFASLGQKHIIPFRGYVKTGLRGPGFF